MNIGIDFHDALSANPQFYKKLISNWEDVTYYLPRRKRMYEGRKGEGDSWIYILSNKSQPGM